jgi:transposase-like protein
MSQLVRVQNFFVSMDGFGAGEGQSLEAPFGHAERRGGRVARLPADLASWAFATASWPNRTEPGGTRGLDDYFTRDFTHNIGAEIMGRNKFGPQRGPWENLDWKGWWGDNRVCCRFGRHPMCGTWSRGRMATMPKKFPPEFKRDVVTVARRGDLSVAEVAADFDVSVESVRRWMRQADIDDGIRDGLTTAEQSELVQLRRDKRRLEMENEILRRAAAYFAKDALPK